MTFFWDVVPLLVTVVSFMAYVLISKGELTVAIAFPALSGFTLLTQSVTMVRLYSSYGQSPSSSVACPPILSPHRSL